MLNIRVLERKESTGRERINWEQTQRDTVIRSWRPISTHDSPWWLYLYYSSWLAWQLQWDPSAIYILDKCSLTRTRFTSITSNGPTLGLGLMV